MCIRQRRARVSCLERRVRRGEHPTSTRTVPALDPEEACQWAIDGGLIVHRAHPLNCETSLPALVGGVVMPNASFYVRNHFQIPKLDPAVWRLSVAVWWTGRSEPQPAGSHQHAVTDARGDA